jgi:hypothetical protein
MKDILTKLITFTRIFGRAWPHLMERYRRCCKVGRRSEVDFREFYGLGPSFHEFGRFLSRDLSQGTNL